MPRRSYRVYPDSTLLSVATDPRTKDPAARAFLLQAKEFCTLVYSVITIEENGPRNSTMAKLARKRLAALRGTACERCTASKAEISVLAWKILDAMKVSDNEANALLYDAQHYAAAILAKADLLVTENVKDFGRFVRYAPKCTARTLPAVVNRVLASVRVAENPRSKRMLYDKLYAIHQYCVLPAFGNSNRMARRFIYAIGKFHLLNQL